ncbi:hypothetical protein J437_LFUL002399 [Ladona fulva]|uniref:Endonuclease/exonuclease/phosphatase domain-containing protein n=1 Tax=Ladona fulva TaxID=123851 RepID=A0A8K0NWX3_LADFU|nr:hypothetical protein J437_LFUL002399 [Ladona fulva]
MCSLPPSSGLQLFEEHALSVESLLLSENFSDVAVLGDYNLPNINWNTTGDDHTAPQAKALIHAFNFLGLKQLNTVHNMFDIQLDLIFSTAKRVSLDVASSSEIAKARRIV